MMRKIFHPASVIVATLLLLALPLAASNLMSPHRLAVIGGTRPTLVGTAGSFLTGNASSRTQSITVPVGISLLVAYIATPGDGDSNRAFSSLTLNGTAMTLATSFAQDATCCIDGIAYRINPTAGTYDLVFSVVNGAWQSSLIYVWMFSGTDPSSPIGIVREAFSPSAQSISVSGKPAYGRPYIVAGSITRSNGSGTCYSGTNLSVDLQGAEGSDNDAAAALSNTTLTGAPSMTFTARCSWSSGNRGITLAEVKGP